MAAAPPRRVRRVARAPDRVRPEGARFNTARAKGLTELRITVRHVLRSSMPPVVSQFGMDLGTLMGGAIVTEVVFGLPGLGREAVQAITRQDLPIVMGVTILPAVLVAGASLVVDEVQGRPAKGAGMN